MDTKKLRQKILDLAIRGKLVPQDPNDEPASVLLERIRAEKERLIKEGKIKRNKKTDFDKLHIENIDYALPDNWMLSTLADVFFMHAGKSISASQISSTKDDEYRYQCVGGNGIRGYVKDYNTEGVFPIIGRQGALCGNINLTIGKIYATEHAVVVETFGGTDARWAYYSLIQLNLNQYATATAQPGLSVNTVGDVQIPIPPLNEQKRIVENIERWFAVIDELESNEGDLFKAIDQAKSKILDLAIHGKLVPQDPNDESAIELLKRINPKFEACENAQYQFEVPNSWVWITIDDVCEVARGGSPRPIKDYLTDTNDGINWIKIGDADKNGKYINSAKERIKPEGKSKSRYVHKGDFLLTNSMSFGHPYILNIDGCIHDGWLVISPLENAFDTDFLYHLLSSVFVYDQFSEAASGGVVSNLNSEKVAKTIVPLPPYPEQLRIVTKVEEIFAVLDSIKESLA